MSLRSNLGVVRGLGSAKGGTHHWWMQRLTAIALVPLSLWFVAHIVHLAGADYVTAVAWFRNPWHSALMTALLIATFYHAQLGLQVVVEDYVDTAWVQITTQILIKFFAILLGLASVIAVVRISMGA